MYCIIECIEKGVYVFDIILTKWIIDEISKTFKWPGSSGHAAALKQQKNAMDSWKTFKYARILAQDIGNIY